MDISPATTIFTAALRITAHMIWYPITKLTHLTTILLSPFYKILTFLLLPFLHLGGAICRLLSLPFTVKWLERIETVYVFLGTASLIGCLTGAIIYAIFTFLSSSLNIDATIVPELQEKGRRTTAEYRTQRRVKREEMIDHSPRTTPVVLKKVAAGPRRRGLLSQAIIEEEDSDF